MISLSTKLHQNIAVCKPLKV